MRYFIEQRKNKALSALEATEDEMFISFIYCLIDSYFKKKEIKNTAHTDQSKSCIE